MIHAKIETILQIAMNAFMSETDPDMFELEMRYQLSEIDHPEEENNQEG